MKWLYSLAIPCALLISASASAQSTRPHSMIIESINNSDLLLLSGNTRPETQAATDQGPAADSLPLDHLTVQLKPSPEQQAAFEEAVEALHNPHSLTFHKWMTADEIGSKYGVEPADLETIRQWLQGFGFRVNATYPNGTVIDFSGTAGQVKAAFHTTLHRLRYKGQFHLANLVDPWIPAALAPVVTGVISLNDFGPQAMGNIVRTVSIPDINFAAGGHSLGAGDLQTIYNLNPLFASGLSGQGETIAVLESSDMGSVSDWYAYRSAFGLTKRFPQGSLLSINPGGRGLPCIDPGAGNADREATLDAEVATAAAPNATVMVAACANTFEFGGFIALRNLLSSPRPPSVVSISYGSAEASLGTTQNAAINALYLQAAAEGVSVFVSAGDWGPDAGDHRTLSAHGLNVSGFASTPWNVAVGGTDFADTYLGVVSRYWSLSNSLTEASALSYIPEIPWNGSCASQLQATFNGFAHPYGADGYCNSPSTPATRLLNGYAGSGGASSCASGSSGSKLIAGDTCTGYGKPAWQADLPGNPNDGVRDLPDVSLFASTGAWGHGYAVCQSDPTRAGTACRDYYQIAGGTSASAPFMAGLQILINQSTSQAWGNPNPVYYALAGDQYGNRSAPSCDASLGASIGADCTFHDISQGDNAVVCLAGSPNCYAPSGEIGVFSLSKEAYLPAYPAGIGWDFATGIGSIDAANLVNNWLRGVALIPASTAYGPDR